MSKMLMKVQVGPVQEFIAQARSTRDMWAGSYLLSWLTAAAMKVFHEAEGVEFIFPTLKDQPLYDLFCGNPRKEFEQALIPTLPNVFMLLVPEDQVDQLAELAELALKAELETIGNTCWGQMKKMGAEDAWKTRWDDQLARFPIFNWQAVPYLADDWSATVDHLGTEMAARRNTRNFNQWGFSDGIFDPSLNGASKDVLSGKEEIIGDEKFWKQYFWKKAGPYGAMNCIKRLFPQTYLQTKCGTKKMFWDELSFDDTRTISKGNAAERGDNPYMAVIAMDGDRMGKALKKRTNKRDHTEFSQTLARFAEQNVMKVLTRFNFERSAQLVYAGGDDVLVMCPADQALALANALRDEFVDTMKDYIDPKSEEKMDASCGIAVGHYQFPLQRLVEEARQAESRAKNERDRAAFELALLKRSGEIIHWGGRWDSNALDVYRDFTQKVEAGFFSGRFAYALAQLLQPYRLTDEKTSIEPTQLKEIIEKEFLYVVERQSAGKVKEFPKAVAYLDGLDPKSHQDFPNLFLASAFMNRQRGED